MLVLIPTILAGCTSSGGEETVPTNLRELSFSDLWDTTVNATGVNEASAYIADFSLYIGTNSSFGLRFDFFGYDTAGHSKMYSVGTDSTGRRSTEAYSTDVIDENRQTINPGVLFDELDKAGLAGMFSPNSTITISSSCEWGGSVLYNDDFAKLYLLNECGELIPLKQILFRSTIPWFTLSIFTMTEAEGGSFGLAEEMWFVSQDLGKATDVEYPTTNESSFGIYLADTGELMISQQDIKSYNVSTNEIELNDEGLKRWRAFFPGIMSLDREQFAVRIDGQEIFQGRFQSPASSYYDPDATTISYFPGADTVQISFNCFDPRDNPYITDFFKKERLLK